MRDKIKDEQYFVEFIKQQNNRIYMFNEKILNNQVKKDRIFIIKNKIDSIKYSIFEAKFSMGNDLNAIKTDFISLINDMPTYWSLTGGYVNMIWMLSIAIMYEVSDDEFIVLTKLIKDNKIKDWLINYLAAYRDKEIDLTGLQVQMKNPYDNIKNIVETQNNKKEKLKEYLEKKWYKGHQEMAWYNIHLHKEKLYSGYWAFEAGAIAKILKLDDTELKDVPYYPYDLVHYQE